MKLSNRESICLDLIRAVASQAVVIGHGIGFFGILKFLHEPNFPWMQNIAVVVFFILSGFVITYSTIIKSGSSEYTFFDFFADRASRIFSAYLVAIIFVIAIDAFSMLIDDSSYYYKSAFNIQTLVANLFMLQDYPLYEFLGVKGLHETSFGSARVFWTISIEWWIYMFFGVLFFCILKYEKPTLIKLILLAVSAVVVSWYTYDSRGEHLSLFWCLGMGWMLIYRKYRENVTGLYANLVVLSSSLATCIAIQFSVVNGYNLYFALSLSLVIVSLVNTANYMTLEKFKRIIELVAGYSFTLYLVHYSIMDFMSQHIESKNGYTAFICALLISNGVAMFIAKFSERSLRRTFKRYIYKARDAVTRPEVLGN